MNRFFSIFIWVAACFVTGSLSSILQADALAYWYPTLEISPLSPPGWVFPIVWCILYMLMGLSVGLLWGIRSIYSRFLYIIFVVQLVLNLLWSLFFFYMQNPLLALADIVLLDVFAVLYFAVAYMVNRSSAWLFLPYILWLLFATYLNGYVVACN